MKEGPQDGINVLRDRRLTVLLSQRNGGLITAQPWLHPDLPPRPLNGKKCLLFKSPLKTCDSSTNKWKHSSHQTDHVLWDTNVVRMM